MRWVLCLVLLVGCTQAVDPLDDRGQLPVDISAPSPRSYDHERPFDPPGRPTVTGIVLGSDGRPLAGAQVWVEGVDLRRQTNNLGAYLADRAESIMTTQRDGRFAIEVEDELFHIAVQAPGHRQHRSPPTQALAGDVRIQLGGQDPIVVAHRGASYYAPENTYASLWKAKWLGAMVVEVDLRIGADGRIIVIHDETFDRTTNGTGFVHETRRADAMALDAGSWFHGSFRSERIPAFETYLNAARSAGLRLLLDVKAPEHLRSITWDIVLYEVQRLQAQDHVTFATFWESGVRRCSAIPGMECAWLRQNTTEPVAWLDRASDAGATWVQVHPDLLSQEFVQRAHALGLLVQVWTLNHPDQWDWALSLDVDAIATDRMGYLVDHLNGVPVPFEG